MTELIVHATNEDPDSIECAKEILKETDMIAHIRNPEELKELYLNIRYDRSQDDREYDVYQPSGWTSYDDYSTSLSFNKYLINAPKEIKKAMIRMAWTDNMNYRLSEKILNDNYSDEITVCEYIGSREFSDKYQKEYLSTHKLYKKKLEGHRDLNECVQKLIDANLLTKEETEGIEYRWFTSKKYQGNPCCGTIRSLRIAGFFPGLGKISDDLKSYGLDYAVFFATKLMNMEMVLDYSNLDMKEIAKMIKNKFPIGDLADKYLDNHITYHTPYITVLSR